VGRSSRPIRLRFPLRCERLYVADEVAIAQAYLRDVFLPTVPALYSLWKRIRRARPRRFLKFGSWIGGDRDGTAEQRNSG
jgi:phosphoenolpyruvate carboxylase